MENVSTSCPALLFHEKAKTKNILYYKFTDESTSYQSVLIIHHQSLDQALQGGSDAVQLHCIHAWPITLNAHCHPWRSANERIGKPRTPIMYHIWVESRLAGKQPDSPLLRRLTLVWSGFYLFYLNPWVLNLQNKIKYNWFVFFKITTWRCRLRAWEALYRRNPWDTWFSILCEAPRTTSSYRNLLVCSYTWFPTPTPNTLGKHMQKLCT